MTDKDYIPHGRNSEESIDINDIINEPSTLSKIFPCVKPNTRLEDLTLSGVVVIDHESAAYVKFNFLVTICCLLSSYMYVTLAAFRSLDGYPITAILVIMFECVFCVHMSVQFITSYDVEG